MTLESETLFVVGESDELVCNSPTQSFVISGLKNSRVDSWRVSMTNETLTILELVTNDVGEIVVTHLAKDRYQFWIKFEPDKFLSMMKLKSVEVDVDTHDRRVMISLAFDCLPVTFEQAVSTSLAQKVEARPRKSFAEHKGGRFESGPAGSAELGRRLRSQLKVDFTTMGWKDGNQVVEFPKVKITKHEE